MDRPLEVKLLRLHTTKVVVINRVTHVTQITCHQAYTCHSCHMSHHHIDRCVCVDVLVSKAAVRGYKSHFVVHFELEF